MQCSECGTHIERGEKQCPTCSAPVPPVPEGIFRRLWRWLSTPAAPKIVFGTKWEKCVLSDEKTGKWQVFQSLHEVPPEMREVLKEALTSDKGVAGPILTHQVRGFVDDTGKVFNSLDEAPPEMREKLKVALAAGEGSNAFISLDDEPHEFREKIKAALASGERVTVFTSLAEMPPELVEKLKEAVEKLKGLQASGEGVKIFTSLKVSTSLDERPPEARDKPNELQASGKGLFTYQGPDGQEHTYHSLDEMPEHVRQMFEKQQCELAEVREEFKELQASGKGTFTYQGPDGQEHTYHSLDEMPEDVRQMFEKQQRELGSADPC
jgi:hypothetical protein